MCVCVSVCVCVCVFYDAKNEQSLHNMLPRCDGNEPQKTVFTHRVTAQVFSLVFEPSV